MWKEHHPETIVAVTAATHISNGPIVGADPGYFVILLNMYGTPQPEYTALDLIHWDVCFALKKMQEQIAAGTYKRLLISADRPFLNVTAATTYLEAVQIANHTRLRDLTEKTETIINLHNEEFKTLENSMGDQNVGYAFSTAGGGFLSISCEIECLRIRGKDVSTVIAHGDNYKDFALNNYFEIYSSQEFAHRCNALHNVITAFFSEEDLNHSNVRAQSQSNMQTQHPLSEIEEYYLASLYHKTKDNPAAGFRADTIAQAIGLKPSEVAPLQYQLIESGYMKSVPGAKRVALSGLGMRVAQAILKDLETIVVTVFDGHAIPVESVMLYRYMYYYRLSTLPSNQYKSITVGISDFVQMYDWKLSFSPGGSAESILLLHARDKIMQDVIADNVPDEQTVKILQQDLPNLPTYQPSDAPPMKDAEFYVFRRVRPRLPQPPTHRSVPDLIVETRTAINLLFKKKHDKILLKFTQEENLLDLSKGAHTKEELNTRVISLGSTAGEMDVDLLRTLTGEADTQVRSIQLLKKLLVSLDPGVETHIKTLQNIATVRNGYPAHKDKPETIKAYDALGLTYPVTDYSATWQTLLRHYLAALQGINDTIQQKYA